MIARTWHGAVSVEKADAYYDYLHKTGIPDYQRMPGNRGVYLLRRIHETTAHFLLFTLWDSLEAIQAFAGSGIERTRYYPEDEAYLLELEQTVTHYEVLISPDASSPSTGP